MKIPITESRLLSTNLILNEVLEIEGALTLDPTKSVTITTTKNIVVTGKIISKPGGTVIHRILFTNVDESKFVGGGETVLSTDPGMWVIGAGQLDLQSAVINDWRRLGTDYAAMETFAAAVGSNMRIEGTAAGQAHLFIKSSKPQYIRNVAFRYMGPRKDVSGDGIKELVPGRYAVHFHHCENGSRGSIIEGCIARDCNNHVFVPHGSHGITFRKNITYNTIEPPFWYDFGHRTHDLVWENNLVVKVGYVARALDQDSGDAPTFGAGGFVLGSGNGNKCNGNVVIGTSGSTVTSAAYLWPEVRNDSNNTLQLEDSWEFDGNVMINCPMGLGVWQNNRHHHIVSNFTIINCPIAIYHGAYSNDYNYKKGKIVGGIIDVRAASGTSNRVRFEEIEIDAAGKDHCVEINEGPLNGAAPILIRNCKLTGYRAYAIIDKNPGEGIKNVDIIDCGLQPAACKVSSVAKTGETIRLQEKGVACKITKSGVTQIPAFAPSLWGTGTGLKAEYYTPDFKTLLLSRVEPNINLFDITHPSPHYAVPTSFAARWTGKILPQVTGSHAFYCFAGGGVKLWVNNDLIIDKWTERYPGEQVSRLIYLEAAKLYDIKLEFFNSDDRSGCMLYWAAGIIKKEFIPMSQLYPVDVVIPDTPNKPPTANAGQDQNIDLWFTLSGTGSDADGSIVAYKWEKVSGPTCVIISPDKAVTPVRGISAGEYVFKLTVTDDKGATGVDEVRVTVG